MIENYYITGLPINLNELGVLYQPTIEQLLLLGLTNKEIIQPFLVNVGIIDVEDDKLTEILTSFDLFFLMDNGLLNILINSLSVLYRSEDVQVHEGKTLEEMKIIINKSIVIHRNNFDTLSEVILGMFMTERPRKEKEEKVNLPTEKHKKIWEKMKQKKQKKAMKEQMNLCDIINVVCHGSTFIPYQDVIKFTYYQLLNSYKTIMKIENYKEYTQVKLSPKYEVKNELQHWISEIKISKVPSVD